MKNGIKGAAVVLLVGLAAASPACSFSGGETSEDSATVASVPENPADKAARIATQGLLQNAQVAQEAYFTENETYAISLDQLKTISGVRVSPRIQIRRADSRGYEMSVTAEDSQQTIFILRKKSGRIERVDGEGDSW